MSCGWRAKTQQKSTYFAKKKTLSRKQPLNLEIRVFSVLWWWYPRQPQLGESGDEGASSELLVWKGYSPRCLFVTTGLSYSQQEESEAPLIIITLTLCECVCVCNMRRLTKSGTATFHFLLLVGGRGVSSLSLRWVSVESLVSTGKFRLPHRLLWLITSMLRGLQAEFGEERKKKKRRVGGKNK